MKYAKLRNDDWAIRLIRFPLEKRKEVKKLAEKERMSVGAYVAKLLDRCVENAKEVGRLWKE